MPSRTIHLLSYACLTLAAAYVALIATTLFFASVRSSLSSELALRESAVAALETEYYDALARLDTEDFTAAGFDTPRSVSYVIPGGDTAVTRADR
jgi:hypothetical protein